MKPNFEFSGKTISISFSFFTTLYVLWVIWTYLFPPSQNHDCRFAYPTFILFYLEDMHVLPVTYLYIFKYKIFLLNRNKQKSIIQKNLYMIWYFFAVEVLQDTLKFSFFSNIRFVCSYKDFYIKSFLAKNEFLEPKVIRFGSHL